MSWEIILKNEDEYSRLYTKAMEFNEHRNELIRELKTASPKEKIIIQETIIGLDREILDLYIEIDEKYGHQETHERLGDER